MNYIEKQRYYFANKGPSSQAYGFSGGHVWMWELDCEESWAPKNWCFWTVVLEKTLESLLDCKEIKPVNPKGNQPRIFIIRTDLKLKLQYFGHLMRKADSLGKTLMLGKIEAGGEENDRGPDGWMESLAQWTWVWASSWRVGVAHGVRKSWTQLND